MRKFLILGCLVISVATYSQQQKIDSISKLIKNAPTDTGRISLYVKKIELLARRNLDTAILLSYEQVRKSGRTDPARPQTNMFKSSWRRGVT